MTTTTPVAPMQDRLIGSAARTWAEHLAVVGPLPGMSGSAVPAVVEAAGLTGRGGAGFPTARKIATVAAGGSAVVVGNGAEGEPGSSKDCALLSAAPHLVLDGLALVARAVGAGAAYLYAPSSVIDDALRPAVAERRDVLPVRLVPSADTFVSGQESAVVAAIEGRAALPTATPPAVFTRGVSGRPTLVQNVETLAHLALIARRGPEWFRALGTPDEPGTRLVTVSGGITRPGVLEIPGGTPLGDILEHAGGPSEPLQAALIGGYHGGWVPWNARNRALPFTRRALQVFDASPGAGVVMALPARTCGVQAAAGVLAYLAGQSAGQCGPCHNGLPAIATTMTALAAGRARRGARQELIRLAGLVDGRGACAHPDGSVRQLRSALRTFADDIDAHLVGGCLTGPLPGFRPTRHGDR